MPQLDLFIFFSYFFSSFFFLGGLFIFQTSTLPFLLSFIKFSSNRIYYYYFFLLFLSSNSVCLFFLPIFYNIGQLLFLYKKLIILNSIAVF